MITPHYALVEGNDMGKENNGGDATAAKTYFELKAHFEQTVATGCGSQQRRNFLSALSTYQTFNGRIDSDPVGPELNGDFEQHLTAFTALRNNPGTAHNLKSLLRGWQAVYEGLLASDLPFKSFHEAVSHYLDRGQRLDPSLTDKVIAAKAGIDRATLRDWRLRTQSPLPSHRDAVEKLESVLAAPKGALSRFVHDHLRKQANGKTGLTAYRERTEKLKASEIRFREDQISIYFREDWRAYLNDLALRMRIP